MRSYKDSLVEYLETQSFNKLNKAWGSYFLKDVVEDNSAFQIINGLPPFDSVSDLNFYADVIPSDFLINHFDFFGFELKSKSYKILIDAIKNFEAQKIQEKFDDFSPNYFLFKEVMEFPSTNNFLNFSNFITKTLVKSGVKLELITKLLNTKKNNELENISLIENFYDSNNYNLNKPLYEFNQSTTVVGSYTFDFNSLTSYNSIKNVWQSKVIYPSSPFFKGNDEGLDILNSKAILSAVKVFGTVTNLKKHKITTGDWYSQDLIKELFDEDSSYFSDKLSHREGNEIQRNLKTSYSNFYTVEEFDLEIEIDTKFSLTEIELLREVDFSVFPFYLNLKHEHFKWIDYNEKGSLIIKIKSKKPQTTVVSADLKVFKDYVVD